MTPLSVAILAALVAWHPADPQTGADSPKPAADRFDARAPAGASADAASVAALVEQYRPKLSEAWLRELVLIFKSSSLTPENFEPAVDLASAAAELTPDDPEAWRMALIAARLCAPGVPRAREVEHLAVKQIVRLDPSDESAQLLRLSSAVASYGTAEERLAAYRKLLTPESRQMLGPALASRLALEMALLQDRMGDVDGFAQTLADAVSMDPAFPAATELAAGFFAGRVDDTGAAAELLVAAIVSNPTRLATYVDLGAVLLAEGAYRSAVRIYHLALLVNADESVEAGNELTCDLALAQWGAGDETAALVTVRRRIERLDYEYRRVLSRFESERPQRDLAMQNAPLMPLMAALYAVLAQATQAEDQEKAVARLSINFKALAERMAKQGDDGERRMAALLLESAWATLLLGNDPTLVPKMVMTAHEASPVDEEALNRFAGWQRLRTGDVAGALEGLRPLVEGDAMARLGYGEALIADGDVRDGAREILAVANAERGTALGLFAAGRLQALVGAKPGPGPSAAALDAAVAQLPQGFDRFIESSSSALGLLIEPEKTTYAPFERVRFRVTLSNQSPLTLSIGPQGPIGARAACSVSVSSVGSEDRELPVALIPIDQRLELAPRESVTFIYDASLTALGAMLMAKPMAGCTAVARCVVNYLPMDPRVRIAFMGREAMSVLIRVNGVRDDDEWVESTWAALRAPEGIPDPTLFVLMAHHLMSKEDLRDRALMASLAERWQELAGLWKKYPPLVQSWMLMVMPVNSEADGPLKEVMRESSDPMVIVSYLLKRVSDVRDSALDVARRNGDPRLGRLADGVQRAIERRVDDRQRDLGLTPVP